MKIEDILVSKLIMGTDKIDTIGTDKDVFALYDGYINKGGNCFDTARMYVNGQSEEVLGRYLKSRRNRDDVIISTKGGFPHLNDKTRSRLSKDEIFSDCDASLKALQIDKIDLYWLHRDDESIDVGEIIEPLNELIKLGKVDKIGASNWSTQRIEQANNYAKSHGLKGFSASQIQWSAAVSDEVRYNDYGLKIMHKSQYDWYLKSNMPIFAFAPIANGFFNKLSSVGANGMSDKLKARFLCDENLRRAHILSDICHGKNCSVTNAALAYLIFNKLPTAAITGAKTMAYLNDAFDTFNFNFDQFDFEI